MKTLKFIVAAGVFAAIFTDEAGKRIKEIRVPIPDEVRVMTPVPLAAARQAERRGGYGIPCRPVPSARFGSVHFRHVVDARFLGRISETAPVVAAVSPDGSLLACERSGQLQLWDANTGRLLFRLLSRDEAGVNAHDSRGLAFAPDSKQLAAYSRGRKVSIFAVETGKVVKEIDIAHLAASWPRAGPGTGSLLREESPRSAAFRDFFAGQEANAG